jgi:GNAT superfamily N-acetyltransferase
MPSDVRQERVTPKIELLTEADIPHNVALAQSVGWKDTESDWLVAYESALVFGVRGGTGLIAQGALGLFGDVGTVAKLVVSQDLQRHGLGQSLLDAILEVAKTKKVKHLGLVATPQGRPLFESRGFVPVGEVVVLMGTPHVPIGHGHAPSLEDLEAAIVLDEQLLHCKRNRMVRARERQATATAGLKGQSGQLKGYALATELGSHALIGPVVAEDEETAQSLIIGLCQELDEAVRIDVPSDHQSFRQWLRNIGLREQGTRVEMHLGQEQLPYRVKERFALATQAWG